jgi:hypothetical protein
MSTPQIPIEVDDETGVWSTNGLPMLFMPRHFFINNHLASEKALGKDNDAACSQQRFDRLGIGANTRQVRLE